MKSMLTPPTKPAGAPSPAPASTAPSGLKKLSLPSANPVAGSVAPVRKTLVPPTAPSANVVPSTAPLRRLSSPVKQEVTPVVVEVVQPEARVYESPAVIADSLVDNTDAMPTDDTPFEMGRVSGEVDTVSDLTRPRLEFVQSVGPLCEELGFTPGQIVFAKEALLWETDCVPLRIAVIAAKKRYVENLPYGSDDMPRMFNTIEEVREAGLWLEWQGNEAPPVAAILTALILIEKPDNVDSDLFTLEANDRLYAMAEWRIAGSAYKVAGRYLMTAERTSLKNGLHTGMLTLTAKREKRGKNVITVPYLKLVERTTPELIALMSELVG
tara:strand:+ start:4228 stop:5205 length:978 start_codon:yes stop_codon:yes gene_type:complete